jgi:hypothetical protein
MIGSNGGFPEWIGHTVVNFVHDNQLAFHSEKFCEEREEKSRTDKTNKEEPFKTIIAKNP